MILLDANLLIYAFRQELPQHVKANAWLTAEIRTGTLFFLHPLAASAFLRLTTKALGPLPAAPMSVALDFLAVVQPAITGWLAEDASQLAIFRDFSAKFSIAGDGCNDLWLAAFAIRHGFTLASADRGFARFEPDLRWLNPLAAA